VLHDNVVVPLSAPLLYNATMVPVPPDNDYILCDGGVGGAIIVFFADVCTRLVYVLTGVLCKIAYHNM
jgi:hypothetical protein